MKKHFLSCLLTLIFFGCCKKSVESSLIIRNISPSKVSLQMYKNGIINKIPNVILKGASGAILDSAGLKLRDVSSLYFLADSIIVVFDNQKKTVHYGRNKTGNNPSAVLFADKRSLFNALAYESKVIIEKRCYSETDFIYTFGEQDYLNAK